MRYSQSRFLKPKPLKPKCELCGHSVNGTLDRHEETKTHKAEIARREKAAIHYDALNKAEAEHKLIGDIMNYEPRQEQDIKYCSFCDKQIKRKNWVAHEKSQGHIKKSGAVNAEEQAEIVEMDGLANKICSFCDVPFASWAQHKQGEAHKLNWAEAELAKLLEQR